MTDPTSDIVEGDKSDFKALLDDVEQAGHDIAAKFLDEVEHKLLKLPMKNVPTFKGSNEYVDKFRDLLLSTEKQGQDVLREFRLGIRRHLFYAHEKVEREEARRREVHVVVAGLEGAGKTSLLYDTVLDMKLPTSPTTEHHNVEKFQYRDKDFVISDLAEQALASRRRSIWETHHQKGVHLIVFVVDSTDQSRFAANKDLLLSQLLTNDRLKTLPIVVCANKCDKKDAVSIDSLSKALDLKSLTNKLTVIPTQVLDNHTSTKALIQILSHLAGNKYHEIYHLICEYAVPHTGFQIAFDWYLDMLDSAA
jgi:ADP-ribosylation factor protein 1